MKWANFLADEDGGSTDSLSWIVIASVVAGIALAAGLAAGDGASETGARIGDTLDDDALPQQIWPGYKG